MKKIITTVVFMGCLLAFGIWIFAKKDTVFSANENRNLTSRSEIAEDYKNNLEEYLSDQFPFRDVCMKFSTALKLATGRKDIGNTYIGDEGYLFEKVEENDIELETFDKNLQRVDKIAAEFPDIDFKIMLVPSSGTVLKEYLPSNASMYDAKALYEEEKNIIMNCDVIDLYDAMYNARHEYIYYRTDHHWTSYGAYIGYKTLMGETGAFGEYKAEKVTEEFLGSLYSRTLTPFAKADEIELPVIDENISNNVYDRSYLEEKDKYKVFQGGNFGYLEIAGSGDKGTLLLIKDSFANSLVPYLTADYSKIIMIDMRYFADSLKTILGSGEICQVCVVYEMNNFATETNLAKMFL